MTLLASELLHAISVAVEAAGSGPDSYQVWQTQDERGLNKLVIAVSPDVRGMDEAKLVGAVLDHLQRGRPGSTLAADLWRQAATLQVVRERPRLSQGQKLLPVLGKGTHGSDV